MRTAKFVADGCNDTYIVYENGKIVRERGDYEISQSSDKDGYLVCSLWCYGKTKRYRVHRIVMMAFCPIDNPDDYVVNHKDGNVKNNNLSNLEWTTVSGNLKHAFTMGFKSNGGEKNAMAKLSNSDVLDICELISNGIKICEIAKKYNVKPSAISRIKNKKRWADITQEYDFVKCKNINQE